MIVVKDYDGGERTYSLDNIRQINDDYSEHIVDSIKDAIERNQKRTGEPIREVYIGPNGDAITRQANYNKKRNKIVVDEITRQLNLDPGHMIKSMNYLKNQHGPNKQAKSLINKKDAWNSEDYQKLNKILDEPDKLLDNNVDALTEKLKDDELNTLTYDDIAEKTEKYKLLEKHADKLDLKELYDDAKTTEVTDEIEGLDDLYELSASENDKLDRLVDISKSLGVEDELVEKYIREFNDNLVNDKNKLERLESILTNGLNLEDKTLSDKLKYDILENEKKYIAVELNAINDSVKKLNVKQNIFSEEGLLKKRMAVIHELEILKNNQYLSDALKQKSEESDEKIINDMVNFYWTSLVLIPFSNKDSNDDVLSVNTPKIKEIFDLKKGEVENLAPYLVSDDTKRNAILTVIQHFPSNEQLMGDKDISDFIYKQIKSVDGHKNDFAEMILDLVKYQSSLIKVAENSTEPAPELTTDLGKLICKSFGENLFNVSLSDSDPKKDKKIIGVDQLPYTVSGIYYPGITTEENMRNSSLFEKNRKVTPRPDAKTPYMVHKETIDSIKKKDEEKEQGTINQSAEKALRKLTRG